jgi:penicillin-binding protein A
MDRQIRRLALAMGILFVVLFAQLNYLQVFAASRLFNDDANLKRQIVQEFESDRGDILASDERTVLAESEPTPGRLKFLRRYPEPELYAHITGFSSLVFGNTRLEATYNDFLAARATELLPSKIEDLILNRVPRGATVITTIDPTLQQVAAEELERQVGEASEGGGGAVVALDPTTGDVLAMVTTPSYDPNTLSSHDPQAIRDAMRALRPNDLDTPLLSNATDRIFPPGSTFKIIDMAAALENGLTPQTRFPNPPELDLPQTTETLENFGGEHCADGADSITLREALIESCNVTFAQLGLDLGPQLLFAQARAFGFGRDVNFDVPFAEGQFPEPETFVDRAPAVAFSAIGQQDVAANPLQMALVAGAIANGGVQMEPHLLRQIRDPRGVVIDEFRPREFGRPMSSSTAATLTELMVGVVEEGTGTAAQIPGIRVAGKTGTAQTAGGDPHAWFVCFAPAENPQIAVAVVVLNGGNLASEATGGQVAAPVARAVVQAALQGGG